MVVNCFSYHRLISPVPTNYVMLGYEPSDDNNNMGAVKTAMGVTRFAPAVTACFRAQEERRTDTAPDWFGVCDALKRFERLKAARTFCRVPRVFIPHDRLPSKSKGLSYRLNKHSRVLLGGGWKQFSDETIDKLTLYNMVKETFGVPSERCRDFYSAVEHSVAYAECKNHHLHVPIWSRVIIRDVKTLEPVGYDRPGFLSFVTPLIKSAPLTSVMMGDLAVLRDGKSCGCGIDTPYFEVLGRAGVSRMRSCAISADELMR